MGCSSRENTIIPMRTHAGRPKLPRRPSPLLAITSLLLATGACGSDRSPPPDAEKISEATILLASEPAGINGLVSGGGRATQDLIDRLFLHLFEEQPDFAEHPPTFVGQLAQDWSWSPDHRTLSITLRSDVRWSDGTPVTAEDARWTWLAQRDPAVGWPYAEIKEPIRAVRTTGRYTLEVEFSAQTPNQLALLNEGVILPRHAWSELPFAEWPQSADWFFENAVTNGPFIIDSWQRQQHLILRRNPDYYQAGLPRLDRVLLRIVPLRQNRLAELAAGSADFVAQLTPAEARRLEQKSGVEIRRFWHRQYDYLAWNLRRPRLASAAARRALTQALDRPALIETVWHGEARLATSPILSSVWAHHAALEPWPHDLAAARAGLATAGWQPDAEGMMRRDGRFFELEILVNTGNSIHVDAATLMIGQLKRAGIAARLNRLDFHALIDRLDSGDFDAAIGSWGIDTSLDLAYAFHSDSITEGYNSGGYSNPEVDRLIDATQSETDVETLREQLYAIQALLHRDQPYTFLWEPPRLDAHNSQLRGVQSNPLGSLFQLREWWLADS